jgi:hypothetical protein
MFPTRQSWRSGLAALGWLDPGHAPANRFRCLRCPVVSVIRTSTRRIARSTGDVFAFRQHRQGCPRTPVNHVSGLNSRAKPAAVRRRFA